jgi:hypothetical protein
MNITGQNIMVQDVCFIDKFIIKEMLQNNNYSIILFSMKNVLCV